MAIVPSKRWTARDVLSMVRELTKTTEQQKVLVDQGRFFFNTALSEIVSLLNGSLDPAYFVSEIIAPVADTDQLVIDTSGGIPTEVNSINASTNVITIAPAASPVFQVGNLIIVTFYDSTVPAMRKWTGKITSVDGTGKIGTYTVIAGSDATMGATAEGTLTILRTNSTLSYDMSGLGNSVDKVVQIWDSTYGQCVYVEPGAFFSLGRTGWEHQSYKSDIVWTQLGNTVYFKNGASVVTPGTKTIVFQRQPTYPTAYDDTEYVDLADKHVPLLVKRIFTYVIMQLENDIPKNLAQEMQMDYAAIGAYATSEISNKRKDGGKQNG